jgi:uncharacterized repeat protein (TIGR03803 family)
LENEHFLSGRRRILATAFLCVVWASFAPAQTFKSLIRFNGKNGYYPNPPLVQGLDGNFYGTASSGGSANQGTIFKLSPSGTLTLVYDFCHQVHCPDGAAPFGSLVLATDGNFYGTTISGGASGAPGYGTIFRITPSGVLTTLYSFSNSSDGAYPEGPLIQATDGNFYGVTLGGINVYGTIFRITPAGVLTSMYSFGDPEYGNPTGLIQASDGNFYGTTTGSNGSIGTVFAITQLGVFTTLHTFKGPGGSRPVGGLVQAADGNFYGTTIQGGTFGQGTVFKITAAGNYTVVRSFTMTDGISPDSSLIASSDGNLYGGTAGNYFDVYGTTFKITPTGALTTLHTFDLNDGAVPSTLVQSTDGSFYGTTYSGGIYAGTLYSLSTGLGPFARTVPTSGPVGTQVTILGNNLTGVTSVTFSSAAASFTVVSDTEITAIVPTGATTGKVKISKPTSSLSTNLPFTVD